MPCLEGCDCFYSADVEVNTVNCSNRNLTSFPQNIIPKTEQLVLTGNDIKMIDYQNTLPKSVERIDLQRSHIQSISDKALQAFLSNVKSLKLSRNKLRKLPSLLQVTNSTTQLWLSDNPYDCNCDMMWMRDWLLNATNVLNKENMTCGSGKWKGELCKFHTRVAVVL